MAAPIPDEEPLTIATFPERVLTEGEDDWSECEVVIVVRDSHVYIVVQEYLGSS